jgi:hypothetical protein
MFHYQQALANMQFQQQAAFLPSGMAPTLTTNSKYKQARQQTSYCFSPASAQLFWK